MIKIDEIKKTLNDYVNVDEVLTLSIEAKKIFKFIKMV